MEALNTFLNEFLDKKYHVESNGEFIKYYDNNIEVIQGKLPSNTIVYDKKNKFIYKSLETASLAMKKRHVIK